MPNRVYSVGTSEATPTVIESDTNRTSLIIQNIDTVATDYLWVADEMGQVVATGIRIMPLGGVLELTQNEGDEPEKTFYLVATTAATPVRVMFSYGKQRVTVESEEEPGPQEPNTPLDAPRMRRIR